MKLVKKILLGVAALLVLAVAGISVRFYLLLPKKRPAPAVTAPKDPAAIERGRYLAHHVAACMGCHSKVQEDQPGEPIAPGQTGSGRDFPILVGFPGRVRAPNLTPHHLGSWSDGEILRAIREGVSKDGRPLFPMMPYQSYAATLSDDDALAVIAYLRTLPPIAYDPPQMKVDFPVSMFVRAVPAPVDQPAPNLSADPLERGRALLRLTSCQDCHDTFNERREPIPGMRLAGGTPFPVPGKGTVYAANLTSDAETGIGTYTDEELLRAITQGIGKSGRPLYIMPWAYYSGMTHDDQKALLLALREVAPVKNSVPAPATQTAGR